MSEQKEMRTVNFIASLIGRHEDFFLSYAFLALANNKNSIVEIIVQDKLRFIETYARALRWLLYNTVGENSNNKETLTERLLQPATPFAFGISKRLAKANKNTWRYLEVCILRNQSEDAYIGDVDIFLTE